MKDLFKNVAANINNPNWNNIISRNTPLYTNINECRTEFERDYTRILHSNAYRRLKHKTQVFFAPNNDHLCTRIEHVNHVESISYTIAKYFGLNTELTKAIAVSHDIGHSPFGHGGEKVLSSLTKQDLKTIFWHEKNGFELAENIELLEDHFGNKNNLNLTYAVRDGILSHCGEIDENGLKPRTEFINLLDYSYPNQYAPYTWEACVVKLSDKIAYLGRDIEDAISVGIIDHKLEDLHSIFNDYLPIKFINNSSLINYFISDLFENSSLENGLSFSNTAFELMNKIKKFNYENIYYSDKVKHSSKYFELILTEIYNTIKKSYNNVDLLSSAYSLSKLYPNLSISFVEFLRRYIPFDNREELNLKNNIIFKNNTAEEYHQAAIYYISGMTDNFAISIYNEIIGF